MQRRKGCSGATGGRGEPRPYNGGWDCRGEGGGAAVLLAGGMYAARVFLANSSFFTSSVTLWVTPSPQGEGHSRKQAGGRCLTSGGLSSSPKQKRTRPARSAEPGCRGSAPAKRAGGRCLTSGGLRCSPKHKKPAPREARNGVQGLSPCRASRRSLFDLRRS